MRCHSARVPGEEGWLCPFPRRMLRSRNLWFRNTIFPQGIVIVGRHGARSEKKEDWPSNPSHMRHPENEMDSLSADNDVGLHPVQPWLITLPSPMWRVAIRRMLVQT